MFNLRNFCSKLDTLTTFNNWKKQKNIIRWKEKQNTANRNYHKRDIHRHWLESIRSTNRDNHISNQTTVNVFFFCFVWVRVNLKYLLDFTLRFFLSRGTDTGHVGNDFLGVFSLSGTRLATVEDFLRSLCSIKDYEMGQRPWNKITEFKNHRKSQSEFEKFSTTFWFFSFGSWCAGAGRLIIGQDLRNAGGFFCVNFNERIE